MKKRNKGPQRYYVPEINQEIKVETTGGSNKYVAHYPGGPERVTQRDILNGKWEHRGGWGDKRESDQSTMPELSQ
jgi:hypothetical protein